jgi:hypothetical protein
MVRATVAGGTGSAAAASQPALLLSRAGQRCQGQLPLSLCPGGSALQNRPQQPGVGQHQQVAVVISPSRAVCLSANPPCGRPMGPAPSKTTCPKDTLSVSLFPCFFASSPSCCHHHHPHPPPPPAGLGGAPAPKRDLRRFVKWPKYVRIQRQRRVLSMRLKVRLPTAG